MEFNILSNENSSFKGYICNGIKYSNIEELHKLGYYGEGMRVGICDTGINRNHSFLKDNILCGKNFTNEGTIDDFTDNNTHGSFVASEILQVAPKAQLVIAKCLDKNGSGSYDSIVNGIKYCVEQGCHVINLSLGGTVNNKELYEVIVDAIVNKNILFCCASGNDGDGNGETDEINYPANYEEVINVGALETDSNVADFSNSNYYVDLVASGVDLVGCYKDGNYWCKSSGTSMACPIVASIGLLLREKFIKEYGRNPSEKELYAEIIKNTKDMPDVDRRLQGHGRIYIEGE